MSTLTPSAASDLFRREPDDFIDVGDAEVAYRRVGSGPDVLFVHGWPVSGATFRHLLVRAATMKILRTFDYRFVEELGDLHRRIDVPVQLVWGAQDPFFPVDWAREMVSTFPDARLEVIEDAGLFSHEERPAEVAAALLPVLSGSDQS